MRRKTRPGPQSLRGGFGGFFLEGTSSMQPANREALSVLAAETGVAGVEPDGRCPQGDSPAKSPQAGYGHVH